MSRQISGKSKKIPVGLRLEPELVESLKKEAELYERINMTNILEASLRYVLSLPPEERKKIVLEFLFMQK